ncbi:MAG: hypothetical protein KR126chlam3_01382, partial [Chlamydiae bacterium]|nr:hypothetical protein [Chlamydiota bacterium]
MFLTIPRHEVLAHQGIRMPYCGRLFYDLCAYRDREVNKSNSLFTRITCELAYVGLAVISLIEAIVRIPLAYIGAIFSSNRSNWHSGANTAILTTFYCLCSIVCNLFVKNIKDTVIQFDCSLRAPLANQFLFQACEEGEYDLAKQFLDEGKVDPHIVDENQRVSTALVPYLMGHMRLQNLFQLNRFEQGYLEIKRLSHWLSLEGEIQLENHPLTLEGAPSHWFFESLAESLQRFTTWNAFEGLSLSQEKAKILQKALMKAYSVHSSEAIANRAAKGKLTFFSSGWHNHGICPVIYGNYLAIGNRGPVPSDSYTLEVFKIDPSLMTPEIVEEILMHQYLDAETGKNYFYHVLPAKLSRLGKPKKDKLCHSFREIAPKYQKRGICALAAKKAALRFAWAMLLEDPPSKKTLQRARLESKLFTDWAACEFL